MRDTKLGIKLRRTISRQRHWLELMEYKLSESHKYILRHIIINAHSNYLGIFFDTLTAMAHKTCVSAIFLRVP